MTVLDAFVALFNIIIVPSTIILLRTTSCECKVVEILKEWKMSLWCCVLIIAVALSGKLNVSSFYWMERLEGKEGSGEAYLSPSPPKTQFTMVRALTAARNRYKASKEGKNGTITASMRETASMLKDPRVLATRSRLRKADGWSQEVIWLRNIVVYLVARFIFVKNK